MDLDPRTVILFFVALSALCVPAILAVMQDFPVSKRRELRQWAMGMAFLASGCVFFVSRGQIADPWSVVVANLLIISGLLHQLFALRHFAGLPMRRWRHAVLIGAQLTVSTVFSWVYPSMGVRVVAGALIFLWIVGEMLHVLWRRSPRPIPWSHRVTAAALAAMFILLALRAVFPSIGFPIFGLLDPGLMQGAFFLFPMLATLGFMLMVATSLQRELATAAHTDPLTGLANRRHVEALARPWVDDPHAPLSALLIDVDHFKRINDQFGHDVGDEALVWLASHLRVEARSTDLVGRLGGEEFVMLLPCTTKAEAVVMAERLRHTVASLPLSLDAVGDWPLTISIGVAERRPGDTEVRALLRRADDAMFEAKRNGRNRVVASP